MSFTYLEELERLRDLLWDSLEDAPSDKRGTLAREYRVTVEKIQELSGKGEVSDPIDELANRRASRPASSAKGKGSARSSGS